MAAAASSAAPASAAARSGLSVAAAAAAAASSHAASASGAAARRQRVVWRSLGVSARELRCDVTLLNGQAFNWRPHRPAGALAAAAAAVGDLDPHNEWIGVIAHRLVVLRSTAHDTLYRLPPVTAVTAERAAAISSAAAAASAAVAAAAKPKPRAKAKGTKAKAEADADADTPTAVTAGAATTAVKPEPAPAAATGAATGDAAAGDGDARGPVVSADPLSDAERAVEAGLREYFQLSISLADLSREWSARDPHLARILPCFEGMRLLRVDPVECVFSFICSSNNNIARIHKMLDALRREYGACVGLYQPATAFAAPAAGAAGGAANGSADGAVKRETGTEAVDGNAAGDADAIAAAGGVVYFDFPTVQSLAAKATEQRLRALGFGYRAKFVVGTAAALHAKAGGGDAWLTGLRDAQPALPAAAVRDALIALPGVGPKVADCIALFALNQHDAIPIDTHVQQIAARDYPQRYAQALGAANAKAKSPAKGKGQDKGKAKASKALSKSEYARVSAFFQSLFGPRAGWAHSILFTADLTAYRHRLPRDLRTAATAAAAATADAGAADAEADADAGAAAAEPKAKAKPKSKAKGKAKGKAKARRPAAAAAAAADDTESDADAAADAGAGTASPPPPKPQPQGREVIEIDSASDADGDADADADAADTTRAKAGAKRKSRSANGAAAKRTRR